MVFRGKTTTIFSGYNNIVHLIHTIDHPEFIVYTVVPTKSDSDINTVFTIAK